MTTFLKLAVMSPFVPQLHLGRRSKTEDPLAVLKEFIEAGQLIPVVDRTFPLSEVPEAIGCLSQGDVEGKIVMTV
jgi:NADPH:quinone reductase-like Zn-dependent oxidoreductase